ncbi:MAG TPA: MarR family transcriptional regulator [Ktedonobacteraceae bacterium]|nr:MarR family transcriptional regulator [Ktedonobacteraceae bacterium]
MNYKPEYESINFLLSMICRAQRGKMSEALTEIGLYAGQEMFLWHLWRQDGLTQSQLIERMCVQPPTVSKMLDRLERTGLVESRPDSEDSRISRVYLTEQGHRSQRAVRDIWTDLEQRITEGLNVEERIVLRRLLLHVHENLTRNP